MLNYARVGRTGKLATITWVLGNYCNWNCSYCWPATHRGDVPMPKWNDDHTNNLVHIINQFKKHNMKLRWVLTGGEPTLYSDLDKMVATIRELQPDSEIICQTNASRTIRWWEDNCHLFDSLWITAHTEHTDVEHLIRVMETCLNSCSDLSIEKNYSISLNLAAHPHQEERVRAIVDRIRAWTENDPLGTRIRLMLKPIDLGRPKKGEGDYEIFNYPQEYKNYINFVNKNPFQSQFTHPNGRYKYFVEDSDAKMRWVNGEQIVIENPNYKGWLCNAHKEWLMIDKNGDLTINCGQTPYDRTYNFYEPHDQFKTFDIPNQSMTCEGQGCQCLGLYVVSKINNSNYNKTLPEEFIK